MLNEHFAGFNIWRAVIIIIVFGGVFSSQVVEKFMLDRDNVDTSTLDMYVPLPKSVWIPHQQTLRQAKISATDTLMVQAKAASDVTTMSHALESLSDQFSVYDSVLKAASEFDAALAANFAAENEIATMLQRFLQMDDGTPAPEADSLAGFAKAQQAMKPEQARVVQTADKAFVGAWQERIRAAEKDSSVTVSRFFPRFFSRRFSINLFRCRLHRGKKKRKIRPFNDFYIFNKQLLVFLVVSEESAKNNGRSRERKGHSIERGSENAVAEYRSNDESMCQKKKKTNKKNGFFFTFFFFFR